jgi:hypothetical protein
MPPVALHVTLDFGLKLGHMLAAGHQVGDLLPGFLPFGEIGGLGTTDQHREVVPDSERMDNVVCDEDYRNAKIDDNT